jgi:hypothetical protein
LNDIENYLFCHLLNNAVLLIPEQCRLNVVAVALYRKKRGIVFENNCKCSILRKPLM